MSKQILVDNTAVTDRERCHWFSSTLLQLVHHAIEVDAAGCSFSRVDFAKFAMHRGLCRQSLAIRRRNLHVSLGSTLPLLQSWEEKWHVTRRQFPSTR